MRASPLLPVIGVVLAGAALTAGFRPHPRSVAKRPAIATEAQIRASVVAYREALALRTNLEGDGASPPVVFLPKGLKLTFAGPPVATDWHAVGGRFSPGGVFTPPNTGVPFLAPASYRGKGTANFAILCPPQSGVAPVPNAIDMPPVLLSLGEDRAIATGTLRRVGDRLMLPDRNGCGRLGIVAPAGLAIRTGEVAPLRLPLRAVPKSGTLLGRTLVFRKVGPKTILRGGPEGVVWGRTLRYELRTPVHLYRRAGAGWALNGTRVVTTSGEATESDDAAALARMPLGGPLPKWNALTSGLASETLAEVSRPGGRLIPYADSTYSRRFEPFAEWRERDR